MFGTKSTGGRIVAPANGTVFRVGWTNGYGRIVEVGSHEELTARSGRYSDLLRLQLEGHDAPSPGP